jgi:hypothetical protein
MGSGGYASALPHDAKKDRVKKLRDLLMTLSAARHSTSLSQSILFNYLLESTTSTRGDSPPDFVTEYQCVTDLCPDGRRRRATKPGDANCAVMDLILLRVRIRSIRFAPPAAAGTIPEVAQTSAIRVAPSAFLRSSTVAHHLPSTTPPIQSPVNGCTLRAKTIPSSSSRFRARARRQCTPGRMRSAN